MKTTRQALLIVVIAVLGACSAGTNTQFAPIGSRCTDHDGCGTSPYECATTVPGGYCEKKCQTDGDCPSDAVCFVMACRRRCATDADCRESEGYQCRAEGATSSFCDLPASP